MELAFEAKQSGSRCCALKPCAIFSLTGWAGGRVVLTKVRTTLRMSWCKTGGKGGIRLLKVLGP